MFPPALVGKTHLGSFICAEWELRITERCLAEDLSQPPDAVFESCRSLPIVRALADKRFDRTENTREVSQLRCGRPVWVLARGNDHRGGTWYDDVQRVVWLLCYGQHRSGEDDDFFPYCRSIDARGDLLPTTADYRRMVLDRDRRFTAGLAIEAPLILRDARESGKEQRVMLGGEYGACVAVEVEPGVESTTIAFAADRTIFDHIPVILAAFHGPDWDQASEMPSRPLEPNEIAFRHHHEPEAK